MTDFQEHLKEASRTVASWPRWKRGVMGGDADVYACKLRRTCHQECGAKMPHFKHDCEPCPFRPHAECEKLED